MHDRALNVNFRGTVRTCGRPLVDHTQIQETGPITVNTKLTGMCVHYGMEVCVPRHRCLKFRAGLDDESTRSG
jgi:hypothetical protein